jgi:hypothetical protein
MAFQSSNFILYSTARRAELRDDPLFGGLEQKAITSMIMDEWTHMTDAEKEAYGHNVAAVIPVDSMNPANQAIPTRSSSSSNATTVDSLPVSAEVPVKVPMMRPKKSSEDPALSDATPLFALGQWVWLKSEISSQKGSPGYISSHYKQSSSSRTRYKYGAHFYFEKEDGSWRKEIQGNINSSTMVPAEESEVRSLMGTSQVSFLRL